MKFDSKKSFIQQNTIVNSFENFKQKSIVFIKLWNESTGQLAGQLLHLVFYIHSHAVESTLTEKPFCSTFIVLRSTLLSFIQYLSVPVTAVVSVQ